MWTVLSATLRFRQKVEFEEGRLSVSSHSDSWLSDSESIKYKNLYGTHSAFLLQTLNLCRSYLNPYCLDRKTVFFSSGHLNLHAKPETGIPYRGKNYNN
jgi:hypothetical protein